MDFRWRHATLSSRYGTGPGALSERTDDDAAAPIPVSATVAITSTTASYSFSFFSSFSFSVSFASNFNFNFKSTPQTPPLHTKFAAAPRIPLLSAPTTPLPPRLLSSSCPSNPLSEPVSVSVSAFSALDHRAEKLPQDTNMACLEIYSLWLGRPLTYRYNGIWHSR